MRDYAVCFGEYQNGQRTEIYHCVVEAGSRKMAVEKAMRQLSENIVQCVFDFIEVRES